MSTACDRFIAGEGELAAVLRAIPPYEPPARLEAAVLGMARTEQALVGAAAIDSPLNYDPPNAIEAGFQSLAARIDAAQAGRRDAVLVQIVGGASVSAALDSTVTPNTAAWVEQQVVARPAPEYRATPSRRWRLWQGLGLLATVGMAAMLVPRVYMESQGSFREGRVRYERSPTPPAAPPIPPVRDEFSSRSAGDAAPVASQGRLSSLEEDLVSRERALREATVGIVPRDRTLQDLQVFAREKERLASANQRVQTNSRAEALHAAPEDSMVMRQLPSAQRPTSVEAVIDQKSPLIDATLQPAAADRLSIRVSLDDDPEKVAERLTAASVKGGWVAYARGGDLSAAREWLKRLGDASPETRSIDLRERAELLAGQLEFQQIMSAKAGSK